MATIASAIKLNDMMSAPIRNIVSAMDGMLSAWNSLEASTAGGLDVGNMEAVRANLKLATQGLDQMEEQQKQFNKEVQSGSDAMDGLTGKIIGAVGAYASLQGLGQLVKLSDTFTQTTARLSMIVDMPTMPENISQMEEMAIRQERVEELTDKIFASAQRARTGYQGMADMVGKLSLNAGDAFKGNDETILFAENLNKLYAIAGTSAESVASANLQLTQALGSGVLRGEEFNAVFEAAPNVMETVAEYMGKPVGKLREMAAEGQITADIVKNALLGATEKINTQFESMPMTWGQVWTGVMNELYYASIPILEAISWMAQNWSILEPIVIGVAAAIGLYTGAILLHNGVAAISALVESVRAAALTRATGATFSAMVAQHGLNAAMLASPITWIVLGVIAFITALVAVCQWLAETKGIAESAFGVIGGGIFWVGALFKNLGLAIANIALGVWGAMGALCTNIGVAFENTISNVKGFFYGLLSTVFTVIEKIAEALNKLPFVEFDYSGLGAKADEFAAKQAEATNNKREYVDVSDAFNESFGNFDAFGEGWSSDAFDAGSAWGDGVADKVGGMFGGDAEEAYKLDELTKGVGDIDSNTGAISDSLEITHEDLKYLRDIAEQDAINRFTTAEIRVEMGGVNNTVNQNTDLDGVMDYMVTGVQEAMERVAEGVHE